MSWTYSLSSNTEFDNSDLEFRTNRQNTKQMKEFLEKKSFHPNNLLNEFEKQFQIIINAGNFKNINTFLKLETLKVLGILFLMFGLCLLIFFFFPVFVINQF